MKNKLVIFLILMATMAFPAAALAAADDDVAKAEVYGGYLYGQAKSDTYGWVGYHGWEASVCANVTPWLGLVADFNGSYGSVEDVDSNGYGFLFGPQFSLRKYDKVRPYARALFGALRVSAEAPHVSSSDTGFYLLVGGGLDWKVSNRVWIRGVGIDYGFDTCFDSRDSSFNVSVGLIYNIK